MNHYSKLGDDKVEGAIGFSFFQKIFFGAPGTGKSFKIDDPKGEYKLKSLPEGTVFRTTFHPDYDYAQFVGSYKPSKIDSLDSGNLSEDQLNKLFLEFKNNNANYSVHKFGATYYKSLQHLSGQQKKALVSAGQSQNTMDVELNKGMAIGEFLNSQLGNDQIIYTFVPQVFANAYIAAWREYLAVENKAGAKPVYLVIEEINRGNCAQIFGDIFQLLDRDENGFSRYEIDADADFGKWLKGRLDYSALPQNDNGGVKLRLPPNFNILATMNTSDQSLFPMDSAFKRRFDWEYVPINYKKAEADFTIVVGEKKYSWQKFLKKVNADIYTATESEDKQMGEFFVKPSDGKTID